MGTGKTTIGQRVANMSGATLLDLDELIEERAGKDIAAIFDDDGETQFRALERYALRSALDGDSPMVIAVGGGALVDDDSRALAKAKAFVVTLTATIDTILRRAGRDGLESTRPLLRVANPRRAVEELLKLRVKAYDDCHHQMATDDLSVDTLAKRLCEHWAGGRVFAEMS